MEKQEKRDSYSHILKYTSLFGGTQVLNILVGVVRNKFVAILLGPVGMGHISLFNSTANIISSSTNLGIPTCGVRNVSDAFENGDTGKLSYVVKVIRLWSLLVAVLGMLVCLVLAPYINDYTFGGGNHTLHFMFLSLVVGLTALTGGETAILKGTRKLRQLSTLTVCNMLVALIITVPVFWIFSYSGIIPVLILMALAQFLLTISYSYRMFPLQISFEKSLFRDGYGMVKLGTAFVLAGMLSSSSEMIIRSFLGVEGSVDIVGLHTAGYMMAITYSSLVLTAMDTDYFPRLSGVQSLGEQFNKVVNRQMEVSLLLISPMLVAFILAVPILIPLLFSSKFEPVIPMLQVALLGLYMRALKLPLAFIPLARGDSRSYMFLEGFYTVGIVLLTLWLFKQYGLVGTGLAIALMSVIDYCMLHGFARWRYGYRISSEVRRYMAVHLPLGLVAYGMTFVTNPWVYYSVGAVLLALTVWLSGRILVRKTRFMASVRECLGMDKEEQ